MHSVCLVVSSTPMETLKYVKPYFAPFKEDFVTLNEDHISGTLNSISSSLTILDTGNVNYVMLGDTGKAYTMMLESYWVAELKYLLVSPQNIHTEEGNPVSFQNHSGFEGEDIFAYFIVKPKVKEYHKHPDLQNTTI